MKHRISPQDGTSHCGGVLKGGREGSSRTTSLLSDIEEPLLLQQSRVTSQRDVNYACETVLPQEIFLCTFLVPRKTPTAPSAETYCATNWPLRLPARFVNSQ